MAGFVAGLLAAGKSPSSLLATSLPLTRQAAFASTHRGGLSLAHVAPPRGTGGAGEAPSVTLPPPTWSPRAFGRSPLPRAALLPSKAGGGAARRALLP
mmetsp:Transcript_14324/g.43425  ORF Transcript_14324/g.43425 Transcript_14324/m.43425 type:complete len:98 (-) Transcript_14324:321-614(-)